MLLLAIAGLAPGSASASDCLLVGDSTMVGTAEALRDRFGASCTVQARVGARTSTILHWRTAAGRFGVAVIGSGSNDPESSSLQRDLSLIRNALTAARIVWLKPYNRHAAAIIDALAAARGDLTIDLAGFPTSDRLHPESYVAVARVIMASTGSFRGMALGHSAIKRQGLPTQKERRAEIVTAARP